MTLREMVCGVDRSSGVLQALHHALPLVPLQFFVPQPPLPPLPPAPRPLPRPPTRRPQVLSAGSSPPHAQPSAAAPSIDTSPGWIDCGSGRHALVLARPPPLRCPTFGSSGRRRRVKSSASSRSSGPPRRANELLAVVLCDQTRPSSPPNRPLGSKAGGWGLEGWVKKGVRARASSQTPPRPRLPSSPSNRPLRSHRDQSKILLRAIALAGLSAKYFRAPAARPHMVPQSFSGAVLVRTWAPNRCSHNPSRQKKA